MFNSYSYDRYADETNANDTSDDYGEIHSPSYGYDGVCNSAEEKILSILKESKSILLGYFYRILLSFVCFVIFFYFYRGMIFINDVYFYDAKTYTFRDRIHEMINDKNLPFLRKFTDWLFYPYALIIFLKFVLFRPPVFNVQIFLRFSSIYIFTYLIRGINVIVSSIPPPHSKCNPFVIESTKMKTLVSFLFREKRQIPCTGVLFSGHVYFVLLAYIIVAQNSGILFNITMFAYAALISVSIVASKYHYSIDAMFSILFAPFIYNLYFCSIDSYGVQFFNKMNNNYQKPSRTFKRTILQTSLFVKCISWIEQISALLALGNKVKSIDKLVNENELVDPELLRKFNLVSYLFGFSETEDLLNLYRGSHKDHFTYWRKLKNKFGRRSKI
ncbi:uncharacterized protein TA10795 [Theileria annulata]|uniref:Sphingomyelin synthase-like domain-containing protein n=1 Tax=Theileria annulata TaxID=5874 RepID=Q4U955_THEAN|nr:uncharacterized protein TA10795 [Theileria annulata]CAI76648.1 hypothetical protein, conserved [Theileria annulata]|eukprot:XP_953273.1 hypothetical protein, conserved [Theileria annulata]